MDLLVTILALLLGASIVFNFIQSKRFAETKSKSYPITPYRSGAFFPFLCSDKKYTTWLMVCNRSEVLTKVDFELHDKKGGLTKKFTKALKPHECLRYSEANFEGSVNLIGWGGDDALYAIIEMRENSGKGVALAAHAVSEYGMPWYVTLGVNDEGPGKNRSTLVSRNLSDKPLFVEFAFGFVKCVLEGKKGWAGAYFHELKVPASGHVKFSPYDKAKKIVTDDVSTTGHTGPKHSGNQSRFHTGTHLVETAFDIALHNYKPLIAPYTSGWPKIPEMYWLYFAGVQDDGITRADEIYINSNLNYPNQSHDYIVHCYDYRGHEIPGASGKKLCLTLDFEHPKSSAVFSPREYLQQEFNGSVVIELPSGHPGSTDAIIRRQAPGTWQDLSDSSPAEAYPHHVIPYLSNKDKEWTYQLILFYPDIAMKKMGPAPKDSLPPFNPPSYKIPPLSGGWVVLKFYAMSGKYIGWRALEFKPNETQYYTVNRLLNQYTKEPFEGSIEIEPRHVISQLHTWRSTGAQHGFTGTWTAL